MENQFLFLDSNFISQEKQEKTGVEKTFYTVTEVSDMLGVKPYILRYWETQFPEINPFKDRGAIRRYRKKDIEAISKIKHLLYEKKYTIKGAKNFLQMEKRGEAALNNCNGDGLKVSKVRSELFELKKILAQYKD